MILDPAYIGYLRSLVAAFGGPERMQMYADLVGIATGPSVAERLFSGVSLGHEGKEF